MRTQTVSTADVAAALIDIAEGDPLDDRVELGGPEQNRMDQLAKRVAAADGLRCVIGMPLPGGAGKAIAAGALIAAEPWRTGAGTFDEWLAARR